MTDKAEELKPGHEVMTAAIRYGASSVNRAIDGDSAYFFISQQVRLRDALITAQAAEIAELQMARSFIHDREYEVEFAEWLESVSEAERGDTP